MTFPPFLLVPFPPNPHFHCMWLSPLSILLSCPSLPFLHSSIACPFLPLPSTFHSFLQLSYWGLVIDRWVSLCVWELDAVISSVDRSIDWLIAGLSSRVSSTRATVDHSSRSASRRCLSKPERPTRCQRHCHCHCPRLQQPTADVIAQFTCFMSICYEFTAHPLTVSTVHVYVLP